jgi:transcriptional regulator with XRE-family HTH domain
MKFDGSLLQLARRNAGLSQQEVAYRAGMSVSHLSVIERGHKDPGASLLGTIAEIVGVSIDSLFIPNGDASASPRTTLETGE